MHAVRGSLQAVVAIVLSSVVSAPAFSLSSRFLIAEDHSVHLGVSSSASPCSFHSDSPLAALAGDIPLSGNSFSSCASSLPAADHPALSVPCNLATQSTHSCSASSDIVRDDLNTMGKRGQSILHARDKVLEILQTDNACSEWYRTKDTNPAATFRTLTFALDRDSDIYVRSMPESSGIQLIRNPYVAKVLQGEGTNATVTINVNGAFFFSMGTVVDDRFEGGPVSFRGARAIQVGPYSGGSFHAQVLSLLHEFGHVIDLLPTDRDDYEGKSRQNTAEVLHACRAQVESKEKPHTFLASR